MLSNGNKPKSAITDMLLTELSVFYYSFVVWFRKPQLSRAACYSYHQTSQYKMIMIVFIIIMIAEMIGVHLLLAMWNEWMAWIASVLSIYAILYFIACYNAYRYLPHTLTAGRLLVRMGFQNRVEIALDNIEAITAAKQIGLGEQVPKDTYLAYIRLDAPQFELHLKKQVFVTGSFGTKKAVSSVVLRVDNPSEFEAEIVRALGEMKEELHHNNL